jgi:hypothetical protein
VPHNYRYTEDEMQILPDLGECDVMVFGPEFTERIDRSRIRFRSQDPAFCSQDCPAFAESYYALTACWSSANRKTAFSTATMRPFNSVRHDRFPKGHSSIDSAL